jgi:hypothetical protein
MGQTYNYGILSGGTGSFGSIQYTDNASGTTKEFMKTGSAGSGPVLYNLTSVSASGDIQGFGGTFGGNVSVAGNLTVNGTTTTVNSTAVELGDQIITLNSNNAAGDAGIYVNDTSTNQTGSLLWDSSADAWMGGTKDNEVQFVDLTATQTLTNKTLTSADINTPDIDGGTIDGATIATSDITVGTGKTLNVSAGTLTLADNQISGDKVEGGTIAATTITTLTSTTVNATNISASGYVSASSFEVDGQASISYDSSALDFSTDGAGAALSTAHFSSSVELQGPTMEVSGAAKVGSLTIGGTAVTSTATELNFVDGSGAGTIVNSKAVVYGSSGEVNATTLQIGGTSITATAAELNIMDGNTSATSTTVADADRLVLNDNGTMVQVAMTDFENYFESALDTLSNVTTVGALNAGSITSGFGSIDIGSSTLNAGASTVDSLDASSGGITNAGAIAGATTVSASVGVSGSEGRFGKIIISEDEGNSFYGNQTILFMGSDSQVISNTSFQIDTGANNLIAEHVKTKKVRCGDNSDLEIIFGTDNSGDNKMILSNDFADALTIVDDNDDQFMTFDTRADAKIIVKQQVSGAVAFSGSALILDSSTEVSSILDEDNMASNSATALATQQSIKAYVDAQLGSQDVDFAGDSGTGAVDLDTQSLNIAGTSNEIETSASGQTLTIGLPDDVTIGQHLTVTGELRPTSHIVAQGNLTLKTGGNTVALGESGNKLSAVYATNVYTGDFHMKNERGDWTLFEESDYQ